MTMKTVWNRNFLYGLIIFAFYEVLTPIIAHGDFYSDLKSTSSFANQEQIIASKLLNYVEHKDKLNALSESRKHLIKNQLKKQSPSKLDPDSNRDVTELIASQGYPVQKFVIQTADGFLLDLHRIPYGRKESPSKKPKPAIYLQHGLLSSSADWVMNLANGSLAFILADNGYDVWMGNSRGNTYSRRHVTLTPKDELFWNWSFDEMARFDTTAFIDFILNNTSQCALHYVGHSQGTMMAFALLSSQPEYQKKIRLFVGLAPIISINYLQSPIKHLSFLSDQEGYEIFGRKQFLENNIVIKALVDSFCDKTMTERICSNIYFFFCGYDMSNLNSSRLTVYMNHSPAGASVRDMVHFAQFYRSKRFAMYDYDSPEENMKYYGNAWPPSYNVSQFKVPALIFTASNDIVADPKDVHILESTLPNIVGKYNIPQWNHLDFVWGMDAAEKCYSKILEWLPKY